MTTELTAQELPVATNVDRPMSVNDVLRQAQLVQDILEHVMVKDIHYGVVPGTEKPTLLQPGAEKICTAFRLAPKARVEDLSEPDNNRYRYRLAVGLYTIKDGLFVGEAVGEASSDEEKYQWEAVVCDEQWDLTDPNHRRFKFRKDRNAPDGYAKIKQVRRNAADLSNTVLKMAYKRAFVSATRGCTAASDILEVDLDEETVADLARQDREPEKPLAKPKAKAKPVPTFRFGKHKGQAIDDPEVPTDYLVFMSDQIASKLDDPDRKRFRESDQLFVAALDAEIAKRAAQPSAPQPADAPSAEPPTDDRWAELVLAMDEQRHDAYVAAKKEYQVKSGNMVPAAERLAFQARVDALHTGRK